jgi:hypothetical protein
MTWQMFHSKKRAVIMHDIVKQISSMTESVQCESKHIYPTAVLLELCAAAFHCDPSLLDAHLRAVVSAFFARAKVSCTAFPRRILPIRLQAFPSQRALLHPTGFKSLLGTAARKNLDIIRSGKQQSQPHLHPFPPKSILTIR